MFGVHPFPQVTFTDHISNHHQAVQSWAAITDKTWSSIIDFMIIRLVITDDPGEQEVLFCTIILILIGNSLITYR